MLRCGWSVVLWLVYMKLLCCRLSKQIIYMLMAKWHDMTACIFQFTKYWDTKELHTNIVMWYAYKLIRILIASFRFKVDMSAYPTITRIAENCSKLEAFKVAHPYVQPDCPEDLRTNWSSNYKTIRSILIQCRSWNTPNHVFHDPYINMCVGLSAPDFITDCWNASVHKTPSVTPPDASLICLWICTRVLDFWISTIYLYM